MPQQPQRPRQIEVKTWTEVKLALDASLPREGKFMGYYIDRGEWWEVVSVDPWFCCDMPKSATMRAAGDDMSRYFDIGQIEEFEQQYVPKMIRSNLSEPNKE